MEVISKPWGKEFIWAKTPLYVGKLLFVRAGEKLSLQYHRVKDETIMVSSGRIQFVRQDPGEPTPAVSIMVQGDCTHIPPNTIHRMEALEDTWITEVSTPELEDVVRMEDNYGRIK